MVVWRCSRSLLTRPRNTYPACQSFSKHLSSSETPSTRFIPSSSSLLLLLSPPLLSLYLFYLQIILSFPFFIPSLLLHQISLSSSILLSSPALSQSFSFPFRLIQSYSKPYNKSKQDKTQHCTT